MNPIFLIGTLGLVAFLYWAAYQSAKALKSKTIEIQGNLLLSIPEFIFKLILLGICFGLANSLSVENLTRVINWPPRQIPGTLGTDNILNNLTNSVVIVNIVVGVIIGVVVAFVVNVVSTLAIRVWGKRIYAPELMKSLIPSNQLEWGLILVPLLLAVAVEEMLFRALLIGGFSTSVPAALTSEIAGMTIAWGQILPWCLVIASSLLFGLMHSPQGSLGIILTGLVGMVFGAVFLLTQSLFTVVVAHFTVNLLQIIRAKEDIAWFERLERGEPAWQSRPKANVVENEIKTPAVETTEPLT